MTRADLIAFFNNISTQEEQVRERKADVTEAFKAFSASQEVELVALKEGYKFYKKQQAKGTDEAQTEEFLRDKIIDVLLTEETDAAQE